MCRKHQILGIAVGSFGLGMLAAVFCESMLFCGCVGLILAAVGLWLLQKK